MVAEYNEVAFPENGLITYDKLNKMVSNDRYIYEKMKGSPNGIIQRWQTTSDITVSSVSVPSYEITVFSDMPFTVEANRYIGFYFTASSSNSPSASYASWNYGGITILIDGLQFKKWSVVRPWATAADALHMGPYFAAITDRLTAGDHLLTMKAWAYNTLGIYFSYCAFEFPASATKPTHFWIEDLGEASIISSPPETALNYTFESSSDYNNKK